MTQTCSWDGCNEEIQQWQTYCNPHYMEMQNKQQMSQGQKPTTQKFQPPEIPPQVVRQKIVEQPVRQRHPVEEMEDEDEPNTEPLLDLKEMREERESQARTHQTQSIPLRKNVQEQIVEENEENGMERPLFSQLTDEDRLAVRQVAFKGAIELVASMNIGDRNPEQILSDIEMLTNNFSDLIMTDYDQ